MLILTIALNHAGQNLNLQVSELMFCNFVYHGKTIPAIGREGP
jgi:hypothetical protein